MVKYAVYFKPRYNVDFIVMEDYTCFVELIVILWILVNNRCAVQFREFVNIIGILCGFCAEFGWLLKKCHVFRAVRLMPI